MKKCVFVLFMVLPVFVVGQKKQGKQLIDSLLLVISKTKDDTVKVQHLALISYTYSSINPEEGIKFGQQAIELSKKLKWKKGVATAHVDIAINLESLSEHEKALQHYADALQLYIELKDSNGLAAVNANIGLIYKEGGDYPKALGCLLLALDISKTMKDIAMQAIIKENIGNIYFEQGDYKKAERYYQLAFGVLLRRNDKPGIARCYGNMGRVYDAEGNYDSALVYHFKALKVNEELGYKNSGQINLANIGLIYSKKKEYKNAVKYQFKALKISEELNNKSSIAVNLGNIGETYFYMATDTLRVTAGADEKAKYLDKAITYLSKAIDMCTEINFLGPKGEFSKYISDVYLLKTDYKNALHYFKEHEAIKDSLFSQENKIQLSNLEGQHELTIRNKDLELKSKQIEIANLEAVNRTKENILYLLGLGLLTLLAIIVNTRYRNRIRKQRVLLREIAQLQSHEIRGPVSRILGLVQLFNHEDSSDPLNKEVINYITVSATDMDEIITKVVTKTYENKKAKEEKREKKIEGES